MTLPVSIKTIQRMVGAIPDGVFGPESARLTLAELSRVGLATADAVPKEDMDARSETQLATLDPKAQPLFREFYHLANATAATFGCTYILIGGNRSWEEQDRLFAQPHDGRDNDGDGRIDESDEHVTNAKGGESNHNFRIAGDFGVFQGKAYLDNTNPGLAAKVHAACSLQAKACGLEWGGSWVTFKDTPHYQVATGQSLAQLRNLYKERGSVL